MKRIPTITKLVVCCTAAVTAADRGAVAATLAWDPAAGVHVRTPVATLRWDRNGQLPAPVLKFGTASEAPLKTPRVSQPSPDRLNLAYQVVAPDGTAIRVMRGLTLSGRDGETDVAETFELTPEKPITADLEIQRPFAIAGVKAGVPFSAVCPLFNGWARPYAISGKPLEVEYKLGNMLGGNRAERLALPVIQLEGQGAWRAAVSTDCRFSALMSVSAAADGTLQGVIRYRYACGQVPLTGSEKRNFGLWIAPPPPPDEPFGKSIDSFFRLTLPDVPPGPRWLHDIAMVYYDYLSGNGAGWEKDVHELARLLTPQQCTRVALCFHGWYESIGGYGYDDSTGRMKPQWTAMERTRKVRLTQQEVTRRLRAAKQLGFRVLWYFGDGLLQDSKAPFPDCYHPEWDVCDAAGKRIGGWQGPDTWGPTYARNPAHPEVVRWYGRYLRALLEAYGDEVDGFVWDETFYAGAGLTTGHPQPAYCDRTMMDLVGALRRQVKAADPEKVFLTSDCLGVCGSASYAMVADGTFQDTCCKPSAWSYGLFPNWRNTLWSCCWQPVSRFSWMRWSVENLGTPVSISNGWGDNKGPSQWDPKTRDTLMELLHKRLTKTPVRFLSEDPTKLPASSFDPPPASDPIPVPATGERNWALASNGAKATASSQYDRSGGKCGPSGLIDGVRDNANWMKGHGWASQPGQPLPQWVKIAFPQARSISRFVVVTYAAGDDPSSLNIWGVKNYDIEICDSESGSWKPVVSEKKDRLLVNRVHVLDKPIRATKFRVIVRAVASHDDSARLLQVEAWGKE